MAFTVEDKTVIKFLRQTKGHSAKQLLKMFPDKQWTLGGLNHLVCKIDKTGNVRRMSGSDQPRCTRTDVVIDQVGDLELRQTQSHSSQRQIARQVGISLTSVNRIVKNDLQLKCHKKRRAHELTEDNKKCVDCCRKLLKRYPVGTKNLIWFTDEKLFTMAAPSNTQNDRIYAPAGVRKRTSHPSACYAVDQRSANR